MTTGVKKAAANKQQREVSQKCCEICTIERKYWQCGNGCGLGFGKRHTKWGLPRGFGLGRLGFWAALDQRTLLTLVSFHNAQVFRLLLKTSVERNTNELNLFLVGSAIWLSLVYLWKANQLSLTGLLLLLAAKEQDTKGSLAFGWALSSCANQESSLRPASGASPWSAWAEVLSSSYCCAQLEVLDHAEWEPSREVESDSKQVVLIASRPFG